MEFPWLVSGSSLVKLETYYDAKPVYTAELSVLFVIILL